MNEWKELEIDNLPSDIKLSDSVEDCEYEIQFYYGNTWVETNHSKWWMIIKEITNGTSKYRYRKPDPKAPSHEEIMTKWWKHDNDVWFRVLEYDRGMYLSNYATEEWDDKRYFIGRESAAIPPEA